MVRQIKVICKGDLFTGSRRFNADSSASYVHAWVRSKLELSENEALFILVKNTMVVPTKSLAELLKEHGDTKKRILVVEASRETVFG